MLLDTHTLLWWLSNDPSLPDSARKLISLKGNVVLVSAASAWEIATKAHLGRLPTAIELAEDLIGHLSREMFVTLPISAEHGLRAGALPGPHKDPFNRMLIAQAQLEGLAIVSNDTQLDGYGIRRIW